MTGAGQRRPHAALFLLGLSMGGFFDGILLHQILQWHHLLSGLEAGAGDLRFQIAADGLFHALMYVIALTGLALLWRARRSLGAPGAGRRAAAALLIGFGAWHVADAVLSHWLLGIHRIRMDADDPLAWDLLWLAVFGLLPLAIGAGLAKTTGGPPLGRVAALMLCAGVLASGAGAALPPSGSQGVSVVFRADMTQAEIFAIARRLDAAVVGTESTGTVWTFRLPAGAPALALYRHGAVFVGGAGPAACLNWIDAA
ncbi:DUF2243 domain-containing protein [Glycocaulis profundi]|nr:DUF2243 domain-containing protein [Glycocaulis profundi]